MLEKISLIFKFFSLVNINPWDEEIRQSILKNSTTRMLQFHEFKVKYISLIKFFRM